MNPLANIFPPVIKELETKLSELKASIEKKEDLTRKEFATFCWQIGRRVRQLIKPEFSEDRGNLWHDCKGALKLVLVIDKFQPGVFMDSCVRKDVLEKDCVEMLESMIDWLKRRQRGPLTEKVEVTRNTPPKRKRPAAEKPEAPSSHLPRKGTHQKGTGKTAKGDWWGLPNQGAGLLDLQDDPLRDEESDPEEQCPDKAKFGTCSYGPQCGFCFR
ncbi:unnamed protein product [Durusdinium trenchii]|uniref:Uncharacterized protein n=1 Tax=Durusdinium trenchii TaxID=1381693 RepID=A0ABP0T0F0_9DINO